jgi:hypothetical protein
VAQAVWERFEVKGKPTELEYATLAHLARGNERHGVGPLLLTTGNSFTSVQQRHPRIRCGAFRVRLQNDVPATPKL